MALLNLTHTSSGSDFSLDEKNVLKVYSKGSKNIIDYLDVVKGLKKSVEVDETPAEVFALASGMVSTTIGGSTIYLAECRIITVEEVNSLAIVMYDEGTDLPTTLNLDVTKAVFEAGITNGLGYKSYVATMTQAGTNPPVSVVLENTLGGTPVWSYFGKGSYTLTLAGVFTEDKTVILTSNNGVDYNVVVFTYWNDVNSISYDITERLLGAEAIPQDDLFYNFHSIEIRVYN
jgi:hypothetical protein